MKAKSVTKLLLSLLVIGILVLLTVFGVKIGDYKLTPVKDGVKLGLDINGGSYLEYQAVDTSTDKSGNKTTKNKTNVSDDEADTTVAILRARAASQGYTEANVMYNGNGRFRIELPSVDDVNQASELLGATAALTFEDPNGNVVLDGKDVENATAVFSATDDTGVANHHVELTLTKDGQKKFAEATGNLIGQQIAIKLDGVTQSAPTVQSKIDSDKAIITLGNQEGAREAASSLASLIRAGKLPFGLSEVSASTVSATLGQNAFRNSLYAGLISIILIGIYMIIFYRIPGIVATLALIIYTLITVLLIGAFGLNLTLPGIAGIVLSFGMAVDANVVIFERIIDELKNGKTLKASIDAGFHRAITAVVDSNITTLISSGVLWALGNGTVKGFAITLFLGVVVSMFTAIFVTKFLLKQLVGLDIRNKKLYGIGIQ